ncbi:hypothetical protein EI42_04924 [Thermosporothrix hazakensis]|jgi:hypothetical protein|uniref:Uncharacterized protein n=1 Tax=Thermosporothrix hazakensis TaxID=644383 RepID=A0A326U1H6_THEHA|nr:hypothetical protein EI42_04924 [Thermosporothrix hazakensis]GCE51092.1 hypothetical protein KTH_59610 [Thermosporothrix hazakensis]
MVDRVLQTTRKLIDLYQCVSIHSAIARTYCATIALYGSAQDAEALLSLFLQNPGRREELLLPIRVLGGPELAQRLFMASFQEDILRDDMPEEVLLSLGYMEFQPAEQALWYYARQGVPEACLGLLHLPCAGLRADIEAEIRQCFGKSWWQSEFLPALAVKTGRPQLAKELFVLGSTTASTDCNSGLVLGIALYGEQGRPFFENLLWDCFWNAGDQATVAYTAIGCRLLDISLLDLFEQVKLRLQYEQEQRQKIHYCKLLLSLLECFALHESAFSPLLKFVPEGRDNAQELYQALFCGRSGLPELIRAHLGPQEPLLQECHELKKFLVLKMQCQVERQQLLQLCS